MSLDARIKELKRKRQNVYNSQWRLRNLEYVKQRDRLHSMKFNRLKSIRDLRARIKKYQDEMPKIDIELDRISRYRTPNQKRRKHQRGERLQAKSKNKVKKVV